MFLRHACDADIKVTGAVAVVQAIPQTARGALGNGLRVVAGALIASGGGCLIVSTKGNRLDITPLADGGASVRVSPIDFPVGTRVEIAFGPDLPADPLALEWAESAITMSQGGPEYAGKSSTHWFDAGSFYELVHWAGNRPVRDLISNLDGCTGAKAASVTGDLKGRTCESLTRDETTALLMRARAETTPPNVKKLGAVGDEIDALPYYYSRKTGSIPLGPREPKANLPFVVEAWAEAAKIKTTVAAHVNRTPITGDVGIRPDSDDKPAIWGCGLKHCLEIPKKGKWNVVVNVTIPFMPITTDGKEPNLGLFNNEIVTAVEGAIKRAHKAIPKDTKGSIKDAVIDNLDEAMDKASGGGRYRVAQRQLFYAMRPMVAALGRLLQWKTFTGIITDFEAERGEIELMYRDNRGVLREPFSDKDVPVGTMMAEKYGRVPWTFNKIVYIEKQAFFESLKAERWPERHDCALLTSKGFASRAVKDIIDGLAEHDEPIKVFCVHDADSYGTLIHQTLQEATRARDARAIEIVNLGLEPWEALEMGLDHEPFENENGDKRRPVADYVTQHPDGDYWENWLQSNRYELDAMSTPQFLDWITAKIEAHEVGKVIPPVEVIVDTTDEALRSLLRAHIVERVLREANVDALVKAEFAAIERPDLDPAFIASWLAANPNENWRASVEEAAAEALTRAKGESR